MEFTHLLRQGLDFLGLEHFLRNVPAPPQVVEGSGPDLPTNCNQPEEPVQEEPVRDYSEEPLTSRLIDGVFESEEEGDYHPGPAKIILVNEENKLSAALLMSFDLSRKIQNALMSRRWLQQLDFELGQQRDSIATRDQELMLRILRTDNKVERFEMEFGKSGEGATVEQQQEIILKHLVRPFLLGRADDVSIFCEFGVILDDVFVNCALLPQPQAHERPFLKAVVEPQYAPLHPDLEESAYSGPELHGDGANAQDAAVAQANTNLEHSRVDLLRDQQNFDAYEHGYDQDFQAYFSTQINRLHADVKAEHYLLHLSGELVQAEKKFEDVKLEAKAAGIFLPTTRNPTSSITRMTDIARAKNSILQRV